MTVLENLFTSVTTLKGIMPSTVEKLTKVAKGHRLIDLLYVLPHALTQRHHARSVDDFIAGQLMTFTAVVQRHEKTGYRTTRPYRVYLLFGAHRISLCFFNARPAYLQRQLPLDHPVLISGKVDFYRGEWQITHPDHIGPPDEREKWIGLQPVYPLTAGLMAHTMRKAVQRASKQISPLPEWIDPKVLAWHPTWTSWADSLRACHNPRTPGDLEPQHPARERLAYDELLANQVALQLGRQLRHHKSGKARGCTPEKRDEIIAALPYHLTEDQQKAIATLYQDLSSDHPMNRLLQGDVGCGKTLVAFATAFMVAAVREQAAFIAPTDILARQHYETLKPLAKKLGIVVDLLTGKTTKKKRESLLEMLKNGQISIIIGTHALLSADVEFHQLGLAVIDEQHRFGVEQRLRLVTKGPSVDVLSMTATPIPRTLMMTIFGDMDTIYIKQKPAGRKPITTRTLCLEQMAKMVQALQRALAQGHKVYWVCPLVEESEKMDLAAAESRYADLKRHFGDTVGLIHGRMKQQEKDVVMSLFRDGTITILVATTVIEVGVDITDATIMVIDHAERFGLAQLHQLRGRIGRGERPGVCMLVYAPNLSPVARQRLKIMCELEDGFALAEEDWRLRGGGEITGLRQSGLPKTKLLDWYVHQDLLKQAAYDATQLVDQDPGLDSTERGRAARLLLALFDKTDTIRYLEAG